MNIYDVSREANVSAATVSRVINGSSKVSPATRKKVLDVIHKSGYIPNAFAQGLSHDTMRTVGILCVDPSDPNACGNFSMGIGYVQRELRGFDYDTVIYCVGYDMEDKASCLQTMCDRRVDAIVVLGSFFVEGDPEKNACIIKAAQQVPVFLVNGYIDAPNVYSFRCGDRKGAFQAVNQMAKSGAKDILFLHHNMTGSVRSKLEGYQEALHQNGLTVWQEYICSCSLDIQESAAEVERLAEAGLKFDGVIATEDSIAVGAGRSVCDRFWQHEPYGKLHPRAEFRGQQCGGSLCGRSFHADPQTQKSPYSLGAHCLLGGGVPQNHPVRRCPSYHRWHGFAANQPLYPL